MHNPQLEEDKKALKIARQELDWKQAECDRLENAIEFGRCTNCNEPMHCTDVGEYCGDCTITLVPFKSN